MSATLARPGRLHHHAFVVKDQEATRRTPNNGLRSEGES
jgi:hypothetical protein